MNVDLDSLQLAPAAFASPPAKIDVGARLQALRKERGWTLQQASKHSGVSTSAFSKIERSELSPTISTMQRIANGFGMDVLTMLSDPVEPPSLLGRRSVTRAGMGQPHLSGSCENKLLCSDLKNKRITPILTKVVARSPDEYKVWPKSDAEIYIWVLKGTVVIHSKLYEPLELGEGDSMYYDANTEHVWTSKGPEDAQVLWVLTA